MVRTHARVASILAGERAMALAYGAATPTARARRDAALEAVRNITLAIADVYAQNSRKGNRSAFDRQRFYDLAGVPADDVARTP